MTAEERRAAESILARLIATAYATDHPELFARSAGKPIMDDDHQILDRKPLRTEFEANAAGGAHARFV